MQQDNRRPVGRTVFGVPNIQQARVRSASAWRRMCGSVPLGEELPGGDFEHAASDVAAIAATATWEN